MPRPKRVINTSVPVEIRDREKLRAIAQHKQVTEKSVVRALINNAYRQMRRRLTETSAESTTKSR